MKSKPKVVVAMSGGVDSSVAAALLLRDGYDVIGVTMKLWDEPADPASLPENGCCSLSAVHDARRVADRLGIPHYVINYQALFKSAVIDYFIEEYLAGRTPNPCIACNQRIKFTALLQKSHELDADYLASGHYARVYRDPDTNRYRLLRGHDAKKDQSYVLYHLNQDSLPHILFPLGELSKTETREIAADLGLLVADKPESQEICFIPDNDYRRFISAQRPDALSPGLFVDEHGNVLGRHQGYACYTVGQRKGLGIALGTPRFVRAIHPTKNEVCLGTEEQIFSSKLTAQHINWVSGQVPKSVPNITAKIRYSASAQNAILKPLQNNRAEIVFETPQRAVTPGQSVVFYVGDEVLGGGIIEN